MENIEYNLGNGEKLIAHYDVLGTAKIRKKMMEQFVIALRRIKIIEKIVAITDQQEQTDEYQAEAYRRIHSLLNMGFYSNCEINKNEEIK